MALKDFIDYFLIYETKTALSLLELSSDANVQVCKSWHSSLVYHYCVVFSLEIKYSSLLLGILLFIVNGMLEIKMTLLYILSQKCVKNSVLFLRSA